MESRAEMNLESTGVEQGFSPALIITKNFGFSRCGNSYDYGAQGKATVSRRSIFIRRCGELE